MPRPDLEALSFEAPFVIEKLVKDRIADTVAEAEQLFAEAKRFIVLSQSDQDVIHEMYSVRVDEAWHQFILYTVQYMDFCRQFFGQYVPHSPNNGPPPLPSQSAVAEHRERLTFDGFRARYEAMFGEPLPEVWYDARSITLSRRVLNDAAGRLTILHHDGLAELLDEAHDVVLSVNDLAREALGFVARTDVFYVRELPDSLTDDEKVALIEALVTSRLLRVVA